MTARGRTRWRLLLALPVLCALGGCATLWRFGLRFPDGGRSCAGALVDSRALPDGLRLREQLRVRAEPGVSWGLTLVGEKRRDDLVVVALDGFGGKLFSAVQHGVDVDVDRAFGRRMPWPPENLLRDLHRARLGAAPGPSVEVEEQPTEGGARRTSVRNAACRSETTWISAAATTPTGDAPPP